MKIRALLPNSVHRSSSALTLVVLLLACSADEDTGSRIATTDRPTSDGCNVPAAEASALASIDSSALVVSVADTIPLCVASFERAVILSPPAFDKTLLAGRHVARMSTGKFVAPILRENSLGVWDASGAFLARVGRSGAGPGEFAGGLRPFIGSADSLFVMDNAQQWSVFNADLEFVRRATHANANRPSNYLLLLSDGNRLVSEPPFTIGTHHVALLKPDGSVLRLLVPAEAEVDPKALQRVIAHSDGDSFWIGPASGPVLKYELEQWSFDGTLLRTVRRRADWFKEHAAADRPGPTVPYPTEVVALHVDSTGLLYVAIRVNDARYAWPTDDPRAFNTRRSELFDLRYEVIDPARGLLLASGLIDEVDELPFPMLPGSRLGRRIVEDSTGDVRVEIVEWKLRNR